MELGATFGQGDLKLGYAALQLFPLSPGGPHAIALAGVNLAQLLDVFTVANQQLVLFLVDHYPWW